MAALDRRRLPLTVAPAAAVLCLALASERAGAGTAAFYVLLAGVPVAALGALVALARVVDEGRGRLEAWLSGGLVVCLCAAAAARSPVLPDGGSGVVTGVTLGGTFALAAATSLVTLRR